MSRADDIKAFIQKASELIETIRPDGCHILLLCSEIVGEPGAERVVISATSSLPTMQAARGLAHIWTSEPDLPGETGEYVLGSGSH